jgi:hypothetical protein
MTTELDLLRTYMDKAPTPASDLFEWSLSHLQAAMAEEVKAEEVKATEEVEVAEEAAQPALVSALEPVLAPPHRRRARPATRRRTLVALMVAAAALVALVAVVVTVGPGTKPADIANPAAPGKLSWRLVDSTTSPFRSLPQGGQTDLQCVNDLVCYSPGVTSNELFRTTNGGASWEQTAPIPLAPGGDGLRVTFSCATADMCAVIGNAPSGSSGGELAEFIVTTDAGAHWHVSSIPVPSGLVDPGPERFICGNATHCVLSVGGSSLQATGTAASGGADRLGTFLTTANDGATWTQATSVPSAPAGTVWTMKCSASGSCLAVSAMGGIPNAYVVGLRSDDWGLTWVAGPPAVHNDAAILYASCGDATHCMLVPLAGPSKAPYEIATTSDAGLTWQVIGPPVGWENMPTAVSCANGDDCWIAMSTYDSNSRAGAYSAPTIEATHDGGASWSSVALPTAKPPIADVLTLSCPPSGDGCMGIGNLQDHMLRPTGPPSPAHPLSGPLVISNLPTASQSQ